MTSTAIRDRSVSSGSNAPSLAAWLLALVAMATLQACAPTPPPQRSFKTPQEAVQALIKAAAAEGTDDLITIFGPDGRDLVSSSDPVATRRNRQVFTVAASERWYLVDEGTNLKMLVVGYELWPFPVPLVKDSGGWRFDTAAGKEEVLARRIGRNELAAIRICRTYVAAQRLYARTGHDGQPAGIFARTFRSDPGKHNGLYWPPERGRKASPLGDLVAYAAQEGRTFDQAGAAPSPFHGYHFRILTAQGAAAAGGAKDYVRDGAMSGGFALVAWPAQYDVTGVMTLIVNQDGVVHEQDLGVRTEEAVRALTLYNPDRSWEEVR